MKLNTSLYTGNNSRFIVFYSEHADVHKLPPPNLRNQTSHVAHVNYSYGKRERGLDAYLLNNGNFPQSNLNIKKHIRLGRPYRLTVDEDQSIRYEFSESIKDTPIEADLTELLRIDISNFCRTPAAEGNTSEIHSPIITPVTNMKINYPKSHLTSGKHDFVKSCLYRGNLDFAMGKAKCIAGFIPGDGFGIKSSFNGGIFTGFFDSLLDECMYCYAGYQHDVPFPKSVVEIDRDRLKNELRNGVLDGQKPQHQVVRVLRIGKRVETGSKYTRKQLFDTLETILETGTRAVMPTKSLEFDPDVADLFRKSNSVILYSEGDYSNVQKGLELHGWTQKFRKEQARLYSEDGVNVGFFMLIDAPSPPTKTNLALMEYARENKIKVQILPVRIPEKETARLMLGKNWDGMKGDVTQYDFNGEHGKGGYGLTGNTFLTPKFIHQDWLNLVKDNKGMYVSQDPDDVPDELDSGLDVRMCHHMHTGKHMATEFCGGCGIGNVGIKVVPETVMVYTNKPKNVRKGKALRGQHKLEFSDSSN